MGSTSEEPLSEEEAEKAEQKEIGDGGLPPASGRTGYDKNDMF